MAPATAPSNPRQGGGAVTAPFGIIVYLQKQAGHKFHVTRGRGEVARGDVAQDISYALCTDAVLKRLCQLHRENPEPGYLGEVALEPTLDPSLQTRRGLGEGTDDCPDNGCNMRGCFFRRLDGKRFANGSTWRTDRRKLPLAIRAVRLRRRV